MDRMHINDMVISCIIGTKPEERKKAQKVIINIILETDLVPAGKTDRLDDAVNYNTLSKKVVSMVRKSRYFLIERLADRIACTCLESSRVKAVTVRVEKPGALDEARSVSVEIRRKRKG